MSHTASVNFSTGRVEQVQTKTLKISDDLTLTYYRAGSAKDCIVIANAPGMSIEFWSSIIRELKNDYTVLAFDYREFPDARSEIRNQQPTFDDVIADVSSILEQEDVTAAHFVSWDLGTKVAFEFHRRHPEKVLSLMPITMSDASVDTDAHSPLAFAVLDIKRHLDVCPELLNAMAKIFKRIGSPSSTNLFLSVLREEKLVPVLNLIDMFEMESSMSNLAFHLLETPAGLKNYLHVYEEFRGFEIACDFKNINVPVVVIEGEADGIARISARVCKDLEAIPQLEWKTLEKASHFAPIECPRKVANIIKDTAQRTTTQSVELAL